MRFPLLLPHCGFSSEGIRDSDQVAGIRGDALIVALPGSSRGAQESLQALLPGLLHIFPMSTGHPALRLAESDQVG